MMWTPAVLPPHPSTIPSLSPLAQSVLALIRQEGKSGGNRLCGTSNRADVSSFSNEHHQRCVSAGLPHTERDIHKSLIDFQCSNEVNSLSNINGLDSTSDGYNTYLLPYPTTANSERLPLNSTPWNDANIQRNEQCSKAIHPQACLYQSQGEQIENNNQIYQHQSQFDTAVQFKEIDKQINKPHNLSPDMEFDDMEIYSCSYNEPQEENNKLLNHKLNTPPVVPVIARNGLNFKEIKPRPLKRGGLPISTPSTLPRTTYVRSSILKSNKMEPSDQTFIFTEAVPKFKRTLSKFKNTPSGKPNPSIPFTLKRKNGKGSFQGLKIETLKRNSCSPEDRIENELLDYNVPVEEIFELDDVFDEAFESAVSKMDKEDKIGKIMLSNTAQKTRIEDPSIATCLNNRFDGPMSEFEQTVHPQELSKQQKRPTVTHLPCDNSHFKQQQLQLSEELFVKTQESEIIEKYNCVEHSQNKFDVQKSEVSKRFHRQNFFESKSNEFSSNDKLGLSENLFVKTQEISIDLTHDSSPNRIPVNETIENTHSEELSLPPYQKPFETNNSPDFVVDDLFSLKDDSMKEPLTPLKDQSDDYLDEKAQNKYENRGDKGNNNISEGFNLDIKSETATEERIKLIKNSLITENKKNRQISDEEPSGITNNCYNNVPHIKSEYFQASSQEESPKLEFQRMPMKSNKIGKRNLAKFRNTSLENFGHAKGSKTTQSNISRKNLIEVNFETDTNVAAKSSVKKTPLKQSTLFDCGKFKPGTKNASDFQDTETKSNERPINVSKPVDKFKKPLPPTRNVKTVKASPKVNNAKISFKSPSLTNVNDQSSSKNKNEKDFLLGNTPLKEIKQKCDPSRLVQTSLIKNEPVKRSSSSVNNPKNSKKPRFIPPIAASHLTSQEAELKNYTITVLDEVSANKARQRLNADGVTKVVTTVTFKEGYTLLNKPEDQRKNTRCSPSGVMFMVVWGTGKSGYYWLPLLDPNSITPTVVNLVDTFMSKSERNICFEAQAVYMLLMDVLKYKDISEWNAYDPLIGRWLLDPDNPPKDFQETTAKLQMDENLLKVNPRANTKTQACDLLPVLDVAMNILQNRLVKGLLWTVFTDMETKLIPILAVMENFSIQVDVEKLHRAAEMMDKKLKTLQSEAHQSAGGWFQLNSPQQLREILFNKLKLDEKFNLKIKMTEHGVKSTSETVLEQMKSYHPLPGIVLEYRRLQKLKSTYIDGLIQHTKDDGTIGTSWEQVSAATGRITSKNPNFQAFPKSPITIQDNETIHLRDMFKARKGCSFLAADFQQIEFRIFAHFTKDRSLLQEFNQGGDIFERLAERWLGGKGAEEREKTKRIVYSVMYGAGANKLSEYLHVEPSEAYKIIDNFTAIFPSLRSLPRTVIAQCRAQGLVVTLSGRRRLFPQIRSTNGKLRSYSERQAMNFLIQGSAADICKAAMLDCEAVLRSRGLRAKLMLMIHDELVWEVDDRDLHETSKTVREAMEHRWSERLMLLVPIPVCISAGKTLGDMHSLKDS